MILDFRLLILVNNVEKKGTINISAVSTSNKDVCNARIFYLEYCLYNKIIVLTFIPQNFANIKKDSHT